MKKNISYIKKIGRGLSTAPKWDILKPGQRRFIWNERYEFWWQKRIPSS
jgi:hypothetical protein